jgi:hypothetical protein
MPNVKRRKTRRRTVKPAAPNPASAAAVTEIKPPRGMKLKTVSRITMLFALLCLGAFLAGRPPVAASGSDATHSAKEVSHVSSLKSRRGSGGRSDRKSRSAVHERTESAVGF